MRSKTLTLILVWTLIVLFAVTAQAGTIQSVSTSPITSDLITQKKPTLDPFIVHRIATAVNVSCVEYDLPPNLVLAVMFRESSFRTTVTSSAGCVGLMQINPKAHPGLCARYKRHELYHITPNVDIGCHILREYMNSSDSIRKALVRYVGGNESGYITDVLAIYAELSLSK